MVTYEEKLDVLRRDPYKEKGARAPKPDEIWEIIRNMPLQWLEDITTNGEILPKSHSHSHLDQRDDIFGASFYLDGSVSTGFRIEATDPQFLSEAEANNIHSHLEATLSGLDPDDQLHFMGVALDEDEDTLNNYIFDRRGLTNHPIQNYTRKALLERERGRLQAGQLKSYRAYCFVNSPYKGRSQSQDGVFKAILNGFRDIPATILEQANLGRIDRKSPEENALKDLLFKNLEHTQQVMSGFSSCNGITVKPVTATDVYRLLRRTWSPSHWKTDKLIEGKTMESLYSPIKYALPSYYLLEEIQDSWGWTWKTGNTWHRLLSLRIPPEYCDIGVMIGSMIAQGNARIYNAEYSLTMRPTSGAQAAQALHANLKLYRKQYEGNPKEHQNLVPIIQDMSEQLNKLTRSEGSHVFQTFLYIHIWNEDQKTLDSWEQGILRTFAMSPVKARLSIEQFNSLPYYMEYCTPGFTRSKDNHRELSYLANEVVTHIPLIGQSDGYVQDDIEGRRAPMLMETHRGTLYVQDDFARGKVNAFNGVGVGTTGSGKSMYYNLKIARTFSERDIFIVIDGAVADGSYRAVSRLLSGSSSYIETRLDQKEETHSTNPLFTEVLADGSFREPTPDEVARMVNNIEPMVRERPTQSLTEPERAQITAAINLAFESKRESNGKVYLRNVAAAIIDKHRDSNDSNAVRARTMGQHLLSNWCFPNGTYRYFVDRDSTPRHKNLTVYDLKGLGENPTLKGVMVASYLNHINTIVNENLKKPAEERCRIWVIIDEAWQALNDPIMVSSLMGLYRAGRGRNVSVHCLTQQMADFKRVLLAADEATGSTQFDTQNNAILGNTVWFNLFKHDPSDVEVTKEILKLPENQAKEVGELGTSPGKYREMIQFVRLNNGNAFNKVLVRPLPWELLAYSSDDKDKGEAETIKRRLLETYSTPENRRKARQEYANELEDAGFEGAGELLNDDQILEVLTSLRLIEKREAKKKIQT